MKKSKLFMAAGAFILTLSAIFATKANKKFAQVTTAVTKGNSSYIIKATTASGLLMTTTTNGNQLKLHLNGGLVGGSANSELVTKTGGNSAHSIYFR